MSRSISVDWGDPEFTENIDFTCPFCGGGMKKVCGECDEDHEVICPDCLGACYRIADDGETHIDCERCEASGYIPCPNCEGGELEEECDECSEGRCEPMMNYAYPLDINSLGVDEKRAAYGAGLFAFEMPGSDGFGTGEFYMSLCGGGMDLTDQILKAYVRVQGYIPQDWALGVSQFGIEQLTWAEDTKTLKALEESAKNAIRDGEYTLKSILDTRAHKESGKGRYERG